MSERAPVVINLPRGHEHAYKRGLSDGLEFVTGDFGSAATVAPREGGGASREYFRAIRLCGAGEKLSDSSWGALREHPAHVHENTERCRDLLEWADAHLAEDPSDLWRQLRVLRAKVFVVGNRLPELLAVEAPAIFAGMPGSSLWLVTADELLLRRLTFLRAQFAFTFTPDIPVSGAEFDGFKMLSAHSLTRGIDFAQVLAPPLLAFSPGTAGLAMSWQPHTLILIFGNALDLEKPALDRPGTLYRPQSFSRPEGWVDPPFWQRLTGAEVEPLLPWWVDGLNTLYSYAADPTHFHDRFGRHSASVQAAWLLTLERMLADGIQLLSEPDQANMVRMQLAFDLLDKAESLLRYTTPGTGFKDLLRRSRAMPRLNEAWASMPPRLAARYRHHTEATFNGIYEDIRDHALQHRRTRRGMLVARGADLTPRPMSMDDYTTRLLRAVRNSSHGLARLLREEDRHVIATHEGTMPRQLADHAALVMFALVADAEKLCNGRWW